jgi:hypothetical protein
MMKTAVLSALALAAPALLLGCQPTPQANPVFSDATIFTFVEFDDPEPANLAFAVRELEREIYLAVDVDQDNPHDRALVPDRLAAEDITGFDQLPETYPEGFAGAGDPIVVGRALGVTVVGLSSHEPSPHTGYLLLPVQIPVEPGSPNHYDRTIDSGADCFADRGCDALRTTNDLTKENALMVASYILRKDYRWIDLNLPDPADVPEGEPIVNEGTERWAIVARSWDPEVAIGENGSTAVYQSYTIEIWVPRDGDGYIRDPADENLDLGSWTGDSTGGGSLRMMTLWSETSFGTDVAVENATIGGIDDIFVAQNTWLDEN